jgi:Spore germination protein
MAPRKRNDSHNASNAGVIFWLAAIVIALFIFALNWGKVQETLARTNFKEIVKTQSGTGKEPEKAPEQPQSARPEGARDQSQNAAKKPEAAPTKVEPASPQTTQKAAPKADSSKSQESPAASPESDQQAVQSPTSAPSSRAKSQDGARSGQAQTKSSSASGGEAAQPQAQPGLQPGAQASARTRNASLYFVRIDDDGVIVRQEVRRQIAISDSPLLDSLAALLNGPTEDELRKKLISLVPQGTKLLSAQVRGSTAFLNFNEAFMYNHYGIEGYAGQLKQVVYTATAFSNVQDVQILIEGEKRDYLGGEGVYIGKPLSRNSF